MNLLKKQSCRNLLAISCRFQGPDCKNSESSIDGEQKLVAGQIPGDLGHKRMREAGELKEDDEGIPFYL